MSFKWKKYLEFAEFIQNSDYFNDTDYLSSNPIDAELQEAAVRTVISRSYYSAFKTAGKYASDKLYYEKIIGNARQETEENRGVNSHIFLTGFLEAYGKSKNRVEFLKVSKFLKRLKNYRKMADYDDLIDETKENIFSIAEYTIDTAKETIEIIEELEKET